MILHCKEYSNWGQERVPQFEDGPMAPGFMFGWNADESLLQEGSFDLQGWMMRKA